VKALVIIVLVSATVSAQAPETIDVPRFAVTSVRRNGSGDLASDARVEPGGHVTITNGAIRDLIRNVFGLADFQVVGGPEWLRSERYDIEARASADVPRDRVMLMMRGLLHDRFRLRFHYEAREHQAYALTLARDDGRLGPHLQRSSVDCAAQPRGERGGGPCGFDLGGATLTAVGIPMSMLAQRLAGLSGRVVSDKTGLAGLYDLTLTWTPEGAVGPDASSVQDGGSLYTALREQLGLRLESSRVPVQTLVIDSIERPTAD
jgi:uncharacterized protein (TIGR03435 family)